MSFDDESHFADLAIDRSIRKSMCTELLHLAQRLPLDRRDWFSVDEIATGFTD